MPMVLGDDDDGDDAVVDVAQCPANDRPSVPCCRAGQCSSVGRHSGIESSFGKVHMLTLHPLR